MAVCNFFQNKSALLVLHSALFFGIRLSFSVFAASVSGFSGLSGLFSSLFLF